MVWSADTCYTVSCRGPGADGQRPAAPASATGVPSRPSGRGQRRPVLSLGAAGEAVRGAARWRVASVPDDGSSRVFAGEEFEGEAVREDPATPAVAVELESGALVVDGAHPLQPAAPKAQVAIEACDLCRSQAGNHPVPRFNRRRSRSVSPAHTPNLWSVSSAYSRHS